MHNPVLLTDHETAALVIYRTLTDAQRGVVDRCLWDAWTRQQGRPGRARVRFATAVRELHAEHLTTAHLENLRRGARW